MAAGRYNDDVLGLVFSTDGEIVFIVTVCNDCGATVCDTPAHDRMHDQLDQARRPRLRRLSKEARL